MHGLTRSISFAGTHLAQYQKKWRLDEKKKLRHISPSGRVKYAPSTKKDGFANISLTLRMAKELNAGSGLLFKSVESKRPYRQIS